MNERGAYADNLLFERHGSDRGYRVIVGVDEVGRGCLAGPVVAAAVIFPAGMRLAGVTDSKRLTARARGHLDLEIRKLARGHAIATVPANDIDRLGIVSATFMAMREAVVALTLVPDLALVDGILDPDLSCDTWLIKKGDLLSQSVGAASIIAKVFRDRWMAELSTRFPIYQFGKNKGYGTPEHLDALRGVGPCIEHRHSFRWGLSDHATS